MMLIRWRQRRGTLFEPRQPTEFSDMGAHLVANDGMPHSQMLSLAQRLGLQAVPHLPRLPNAVELQTWLMIFGPLWTDGVPVNSAGAIIGGGHVVVIGGVDDLTSQMLVLDPSPVGVGTRSWRPYTQLAQILSQRNNPTRPVSFLHYPAEFR
jgi:hypothetical protein